MILERLEIQGFKSFAQKTVLEFPKESRGGKGITCVVGPNGSGKSNLADAIRWALGEQSIKTLRGKKSEDVIFSGSDKKARLGFAEVALYFNNEDKSASIDYAELVIARRLYRDGESEYLVNGQRARLQDIQLLLAQANFGQKTYSVIGQGMVDAFLLVSPQERKEFFDEAAGVKVLDIKREQSMRKLEQTIKNLEQAEGLLREIEPRLRSLTRQVKRLEQKEAVEKELKELQGSYFGRLWHELIQKLESATNSRKQLEAVKQTKEAEMKKLQQELGSLEQAELRSDVFLKLQQEYEKTQEAKTKLRERELALRNQMELEKRLSARAAPLPIPLSEVAESLQNLSKDQEGFLMKLKKIKNLTELTALQEESAQILDRLKKLWQRLVNPEAEQKKSATPSALESELSTLINEIQKKNQELSGVQAKIAAFNAEEQKKKGTFFSLQRTIQEKQYELNDIVNRLNDARVEAARLETRRDDLAAEIRADGLEPDSLIPNPSARGGSALGGESLISDQHSRIQSLKHQLSMIGSIDPETLQEFKEAEERYNFLSTHTNDLKETLASLEQVIVELDETIKVQFESAFGAINTEFKKFFQVLFNGGKANLLLVANQESQPEAGPPLAEGSEDQELLEKDEELSVAQKFLQAHQRREEVAVGVEIEATPPGKRLKNVTMLSGGERALTSLALIAGIIANSPSPFVVLDEVDAALDESNAIRFAQVLTELSKKTQCIVVTHNRYTMEHASVLYGVTMGDDGVSKMLSLKLEEAVL